MHCDDKPHCYFTEDGYCECSCDGCIEATESELDDPDDILEE